MSHGCKSASISCELPAVVLVSPGQLTYLGSEGLLRIPGLKAHSWVTQSSSARHITGPAKLENILEHSTEQIPL